MSREQDFISIQRDAARKIYDGINTLKESQREWNALGYGDNLDAGSGENAGITKELVGPVVFDTANALDAVLTANGNAHLANLAKLL